MLFLKIFLLSPLGDKDNLATIKDVNNVLPNVSLFEIISFEGFTHMDFAIAIDADKLIYEKIVDMMKASDFSK